MYFFCRLLNERKIEIMKTNYEKFYEKEQPELVTIQGNELRLYRNNMRLSVSKKISTFVEKFKGVGGVI